MQPGLRRLRHLAKRQFQAPLDFEQVLFGRVQKDNAARAGSGNRLNLTNADPVSSGASHKNSLPRVGGRA